MRVVKEAEERKNEILDAAEYLFAVKGFDGTSTNDILEAIGIARGTLYYHFKSKEEILDAMIARITRNLMAKAALIAEDQSIPPLERITRTIMELNVDNEIGKEIMNQVHTLLGVALKHGFDFILKTGIGIGSRNVANHTTGLLVTINGHG